MSLSDQQEARRRNQALERSSHGKKLRALYRQLGYERADFAHFLQISERTLYYWECGHRRVPVAVLKLLRLLTWHDMPGKSWQGWHFSRGKLWSPEGFGFEGTDASWWSLTVRRAAMFTTLYGERQALRDQLRHARHELAEAEARALEAEGRAAMVELAFMRSVAPGLDATTPEAALALSTRRPSSLPRSGAVLASRDGLPARESEGGTRSEKASAGREVLVTTSRLSHFWDCSTPAPFFSDPLRPARLAVDVTYSDGSTAQFVRVGVTS